MNRCLQLAQLGAGYVAPNPLVGALLLHHDSIIGEGYHQLFGGPHAEVNCINSVAAEEQQLISSSKLYVSLEPCVHFGKTAPCTDLIIHHQIPEVVIGCRDSFEKVNGHGIQRLKEAGVKVTVGVLEKEALELNKRFFCFHQKKRPYIFLKWAQSHDGFIAKEDFGKLAISNEYTNRFTHRMRTSEAAIIVGSHTAIHDNPSLTSRNWPGKNPLRIIIDKQLLLSPGSAVYNGEASTIILNYVKEEQQGNIYLKQLRADEKMLPQLMELLFHNSINSLIVEGGAILLQSFIDAGLWDEAIVIINEKLALQKGIAAPVLNSEKLIGHFNILTDSIQLYKNQ
jgi:diaminohydroxyphosphoribosylaminopyrimidine deaminase/5-amino-6-(5-phosphoribosylamino)uracil reductase